MIKSSINIQGKLFDLTDPVVMGIINLTPDSFYADSRAETTTLALSSASKMLEEGAKILDIGGFSTRPGAGEVSPEEERHRVISVLEAIKKEFPEAIISVDTFRSVIAREAIEAGADIINDITAGADEKMLELIAAKRTPYIMMHMRGPVTSMMENTAYNNLLSEMTLYFSRKVAKLKELGVVDIIIDPGFGFSKTLDQNYEILKNLAYFEAIGLPVLVGISRKSMIYKFLEISPEDALIGTSVLHYDALQKGARILRVHDVKEAVETIKLHKKIAC